MTKPLTILTCYYRPKPGGLCKRYFRGIEALLARGHTVHYLAVTKFPIDHPHCHFHRFPWPERKTQGLMFWAFFHLLAPIQLAYLAWRIRAERIFSFSINYGWMLQPARLIRRCHNRIFLRADALHNEQLARNFWVQWPGQWFEAMALWGAYISGVSQELIDNITQRHRQIYIASKNVFPNHLPDLGVVKRTAHDKIRLGCVGIIEERKNPLLLLEVMNYLPDTFELHYYGPGPLLTTLQNQSHDSLAAARIHVHGWQPIETIWPNIDILLMPSHHEGAPNAVLEALSLDIPVLASNIPAHREILAPENLLSPTDAKVWSQKIAMIACHRGSMQYLLKQQAVAAQRLRFNWNDAFCTIIESDVRPSEMENI